MHILLITANNILRIIIFLIISLCIMLIINFDSTDDRTNGNIIAITHIISIGSTVCMTGL